MIIVNCVTVTLYYTSVQRCRHNVLSFRKINRSRRCRRVHTHLRYYRVICCRDAKTTSVTLHTYASIAVLIRTRVLLVHPSTPRDQPLRCPQTRAESELKPRRGRPSSCCRNPSSGPRSSLPVQQSL